MLGPRRRGFGGVLGDMTVALAVGGGVAAIDGDLLKGAWVAALTLAVVILRGMVSWFARKPIRLDAVAESDSPSAP